VPEKNTFNLNPPKIFKSAQQNADIKTVSQSWVYPRNQWLLQVTVQVRGFAPIGTLGIENTNEYK